MKHLTFTQICQVVDKQMAEEDTVSSLEHISQCEFCRKEVEFQRNLIRGIQKQPLELPSKGFTERILNTIIPQNRKKLIEWLLHNLGNVIAMMSVLVFLWYVYSAAGISNIQFEKTQYLKVIADAIKVMSNGLSQPFKSLISHSRLLTANDSIPMLLAMLYLLFFCYFSLIS